MEMKPQTETSQHFTY